MSALRKKISPFGSSSQWRDGIAPEITLDDAKALTRLLNQVKRENMVVLEVGSWAGNGSTRIITNAIRDSHGLLYCIDTWAGSDNVPHHQEYRKRYNTIYEVFAGNVRTNNGQNIVRPLVMPSAEACALFPDNSLDLVFVDGNHGYSHVKQDVLAWLPKVKSGGIICGHDCDASYAELDPKLKADMEPHCDEDHYVNTGHPGPPAFHAGVVKAVYEVFGGKAKLWLKSKRSTSVWSYRTGTVMGRLRAFLHGRATASQEERPAENKALPLPTPWPPMD